MLNKELSVEQRNLLILLKGKFALKAQDLIVKNYKELKEFSNKLAQGEKTSQSENSVNTIKKEEKAQINLNQIKIYCDGACSNNPGKSGSGLAVYNDNDLPILLYGEYEEKGTNNTAELKALLKALLLAKESNAQNKFIYSDSKYSIDCISKWAYSWKSKGWSKKGGEIKNLELIKEAHNLYNEIQNEITLAHVKAHAGIEGNELADRMAMIGIGKKNKEFEEYSYRSISDVLSLGRG
ncbi:MAG: reverse transcriptase-like protein [Campylobacteraceae bacterium]|nr:reverse transcriptase-like protein [Campylobacteraceae bacterium]